MRKPLAMRIGLLVALVVSTLTFGSSAANAQSSNSCEPSDWIYNNYVHKYVGANTNYFATRTTPKGIYNLAPFVSALPGTAANSGTYDSSFQTNWSVGSTNITWFFYHGQDGPAGWYKYNISFCYA